MNLAPNPNSKFELENAQAEPAPLEDVLEQCPQVKKVGEQLLELHERFNAYENSGLFENYSDVLTWLESVRYKIPWTYDVDLKRDLLEQFIARQNHGNYDDAEEQTESQRLLTHGILVQQSRDGSLSKVMYGNPTDPTCVFQLGNFRGDTGGLLCIWLPGTDSQMTERIYTSQINDYQGSRYFFSRTVTDKHGKLVIGENTDAKTLKSVDYKTSDFLKQRYLELATTARLALATIFEQMREGGERTLTERKINEHYVFSKQRQHEYVEGNKLRIQKLHERALRAARSVE